MLGCAFWLYRCTFITLEKGGEGGVRNDQFFSNVIKVQPLMHDCFNFLPAELQVHIFFRSKMQKATSANIHV